MNVVEGLHPDTVENNLITFAIKRWNYCHSTTLFSKIAITSNNITILRRVIWNRPIRNDRSRTNVYDAVDMRPGQMSAAVRRAFTLPDRCGLVITVMCIQGVSRRCTHCDNYRDNGNNSILWFFFCFVCGRIRLTGTIRWRIIVFLCFGKYIFYLFFKFLFYINVFEKIWRQPCCKSLFFWNIFTFRLFIFH